MDLTVQALVIGGGATGTAIARDLSMRGVSVCLLERGDLASGTTGSYHGLLHSGGRYATTDLGTARECAEENAILRRIAPHCIEDTGGLFLILDGRSELLFQKPFVEGCRAAGIPTEELSHREVMAEEPLIAPNTRTNSFDLKLLNRSSRSRSVSPTVIGSPSLVENVGLPMSSVRG